MEDLITLSEIPRDTQSILRGLEYKGEPIDIIFHDTGGKYIHCTMPDGRVIYIASKTIFRKGKDNVYILVDK